MKILNYFVEPKIKGVAGPHSKWESDLKRDQSIQSKPLLIYFSFSDPATPPLSAAIHLSPHQAMRARKMKESHGPTDFVCLKIGRLSER